MDASLLHSGDIGDSESGWLRLHWEAPSEGLVTHSDETHFLNSLFPGEPCKEFAACFHDSRARLQRQLLSTCRKEMRVVSKQPAEATEQADSGSGSDGGEQQRGGEQR